MHLNYLPFNFSSDVFTGGTISFSDVDTLRDQLKELRNSYGETHVFHRMGSNIACVAIRDDAEKIGDKKEFNVHDDFQLANAVARSALFNAFNSSPKHIVTGFRPVTILLQEHNLTNARSDVFGVFPEYTLDIRPLAPHEGEITSGVLIGFSIKYYFLKTISEIMNEGIAAEGLYAVKVRDKSEFYTPYARNYLGKIESVKDGKVILSDSDFDDYPADQCFLEGSRLNFEVVGRKLLGTGYSSFSKNLLYKTYDIMGAEHQVRRLKDLGRWLKRKCPLSCGAGLAINISDTPHECRRGTDAGDSHSFRNPACVLRPGGSITVPWPVDEQINMHGPYDAESFPSKRVKISVICPEEYIGEAEQFISKFKDGENSNTKSRFRKGFVRKYHLNSCDFTFHVVKRTTNKPLEEAYKEAALGALNENPNLAITVIKDNYRELPDVNNPYYVVKVALMAQGVPVQMLKIETMRLNRVDYTLNNVSLAMYAKLGGIPWTLVPNHDMAHEVIVGIGSAKLSSSRRGAGERVVGITSVFSGDGQYLLANNTREVSSEDYLYALEDTLVETVKELRSRYGWKPKDRVRFIFHQSFKKYKDIEAEAVRSFANSLSDFEVQYAFVHVSDTHNWMLLDPNNPGVKFANAPKGKMVPQRGQCVVLGPNTALLTLSGPYQVKSALQGCPHPILISIHEDSTFKSLDYLARQVFNLSFMSWRGFNPSTLPVSISYSNMIVDLLGHMRGVKNWNPDILTTALKERRWFL